MSYFSTKERRAEMLRKLNSGVKLVVSDLSKEFGVSEVTIRKDLSELQKRNLLTRVRGGAMRLPNVSLGEELKISDKQLYYYKQKQVIGKLAATLIKEDDTIILDSGTTTMEIAKNLHSFRNLTIITNALNIAVELTKYNKFNVILLGGHLRASSFSTVGPIAEASLKVFYCDKLFLGVDSINIERGVSTPNIEEANINQTMISMSKEIIAVFDSSKFNKKSFAFIANINQLNAIVTDEGIQPGMKRELAERNVKVHIAR